jgi:hypothetical protein
MTTQKWREIIRWLRKDFPVNVKVIRRSSKKYLGLTTSLKGRCHYIYIDSQQNFDSQVSTLLHEWAHARTALEQNKIHGKLWALEHGRIWNEWEKRFTD